VDAGDAEAPPLPDAGGASTSFCLTVPPPACASKTMMVAWAPLGWCDGQKCVFSQSFVECRGGCFRQIDGGNHCNQ
jgi:hypothetical protein